MGGEAAPLTAPESVASMIKVITSLKPAASGAFLNYNGEEIPW
jgi:hypothetical protein